MTVAWVQDADATFAVAQRDIMESLYQTLRQLDCSEGSTCYKCVLETATRLSQKRLEADLAALPPSVALAPETAEKLRYHQTQVLLDDFWERVIVQDLLMNQMVANFEYEQYLWEELLKILHEAEEKILAMR